MRTGSQGPKIDAESRDFVERGRVAEAQPRKQALFWTGKENPLNAYIEYRPKFY